MNVNDIKAGQIIRIEFNVSLYGKPRRVLEVGTVTHVNNVDKAFPLVRVDYADGTNGSVHPSQVLEVVGTI